MAKHPPKVLLRAGFSSWQLQVGLEIARHLCLMVSGSCHFIKSQVSSHIRLGVKVCEGESAVRNRKVAIEKVKNVG